MKESLPESHLAPIPRTFVQYLRSFGPGFVAVLTWLGAGDIVSAGVAGGNYGYALMWAMVFALLMRYFFVSMIARYQLCNPRGEGVLDGLARLHRFYAPALFFIALLWGHISCAYMVAGIGEVSVSLTGIGSKWRWEIFWVVLAALLIFRPLYRKAEFIFKIFVGLLTISFLGCAIWVGPSPAGIFHGIVGLQIPPQQGPFGAMAVAVGMVGAVGGSIMNLVYPYFLEQKGWKGPQYRRVQNYDFLIAVVMMIVFNLSVWCLGTELIFGTGRTIASVDDLAQLLGGVLGNGGRLLFLLGVFAAIYTSILGSGLGLALMASHAWLRWRAGNGPILTDYKEHAVYRWSALGIVISPLIWTGRTDFVSLTILANTLVVLLIPALAGGLWWITARKEYIGSQYCNRWWDNLVMAFLFVLAVFGAFAAVRSIWQQIHQL